MNFSRRHVPLLEIPIACAYAVSLDWITICYAFVMCCICSFVDYEFMDCNATPLHLESPLSDIFRPTTVVKLNFGSSNNFLIARQHWYLRYELIEVILYWHTYHKSGAFELRLMHKFVYNCFLTMISSWQDTFDFNRWYI